MQTSHVLHEYSVKNWLRKTSGTAGQPTASPENKIFKGHRYLPFIIANALLQVSFKYKVIASVMQ